MAHPNAKQERNAEIERLAARGWRYSSIARRFGISHQRVHQIMRPVKEAARRAVTEALDRGDITRSGECQGCGDGGRIEAHHADYGRPLEVRWLCVPCHKNAHSEDGRRQARRKVRRKVARPCLWCGTRILSLPGKTGRKKFCKIGCRSAYQMVSTTALIQDLLRLSENIGRTPTVTEVIDEGRYSHVLYYKRWGSYQAACEAAGLDSYGPGRPGHRAA